MQLSKRWKAALYTIAILFVLFLAAWAGLSQTTFLPNLVNDRVKDAFAGMGYDLRYASIDGNPFTGVRVRGVAIRQGDVVLAEADEMSLKLNFASLLSSPKLSSMAFTNLRADYETVLEHLPESTEEDAGPTPLDRVVLREAAVRTPYGLLTLDRGYISLSGGYGGEMRGTWDGRPFEIAVDTRLRNGKTVLDSLRVEAEGLHLEGGGALLPELDLSLALKRIDLAQLQGYLPALRSADLQGVIAGELSIAGPPLLRELSGEGRLRSKRGVVAGGRYDDLSADLRFSSGEYRVERLDVRYLDAPLFASADLRLPEEGGPQIAFKLGVKKLDLAQLSRLDVALAGFDGHLDWGSLVLRGPVDALSGQLVAQLSSVNHALFSMPHMKLRLDLKEGKTVLAEAKGRVFDSPLSASAQVALRKGPSFDGRIALDSLSLEAVTRAVPQLAEVAPRGTGKLDLRFSGTPTDPSLSGIAAFSEVLVSGDHRFENVHVPFSYTKGVLGLSGLEIGWDGASVRAEGTVRTRDAALDLRGSFANLKIAALAAFAPQVAQSGLGGVVSGKWSVGGAAAAPAASLTFAIPRLRTPVEADIRNVQASLSYADSRLHIERIAASLGGGKLEAEGDVDLPVAGGMPAYEIKGSFRDLDPALLARAASVSADVSGDLHGNIRVWSGDGPLPSVRLFFRDAHVRYSNVVDVSGLNGGIELANGNLHFANFRTKLNTGYIRLDGTVENLLSLAAPPRSRGGDPLAAIPLRLSATVASADIGRISRIFSPNAKGYQGILAGSADIRGTAAAPRFSGGASLLGVRAYGLFLPIIRIQNITGDKNGVNLPNIRAIVGRGVIQAKGNLESKEGNWRASVSATGRSVDIRSLAFSLNEDTRRGLSGLLDFDFEGSGWIDAFEGHGSARVPELYAMGLHLTDLKAPFWVSDGFVLVEDSSAKGYGGSLRVQLAKDIKQSDWGGRVRIASMDFSGAMRDFMPGAEGTITGVADAEVRVNGDTRRTSMQDGSGSFELKNGEVIGFSGAAAVSKMLGGKPLRFQSLLLSFSTAGQMVTLLPGSRVSAPPGDPVFKYVNVDGNVDIEKQGIDLSCSGNVNIRALNTFVAGIQGVLDAVVASDALNTDELLQNFLGGAITGFSRSEFRDVSLRVHGTPDELKFSNVEVTKPARVETRPDNLLSEPGGGRERDEERFQLTLEFPVGPGGKSPSEKVEDQVGGQVLEQTLKELISP